MRTLVLCIDRDNDIGVKAGIPGPIIGRRDNLDAANKLALSDPEDADVNTMFTAIAKYDDLVRNGVDAEVATISGDIKVGETSDREIVRQLEEVIDEVRPNTAFLISDGAEDEFVFPLVTSRLRVDHVRRVFVKQQQSIESLLSLVTKTLRDEKWRKRIFGPLGAILLVWGSAVLAGILPSVIDKGWSIDVANSLPPALILIILGVSILYIAYPVSISIRRGIRRIRDSYDDAKSSVMSGDISIFFTIVAWILVVLGVFYGIDASWKADSLVQKFFYFLRGFIWLFLLGMFVHELGKITVVFLKKRKVPRNLVPVSIFFFAVFLVMTALQLWLTDLFGYPDPYANQPTIIVILVVALFVIFAGAWRLRMHEREAPLEAEWRR